MRQRDLRLLGCTSARFVSGHLEDGESTPHKEGSPVTAWHVLPEEAKAAAPHDYLPSQFM